MGGGQRPSCMRMRVNVAKELIIKSGNRLGKGQQEGVTWPWGPLVLTKRVDYCRWGVQPSLCGRESLTECLWLTGCYYQHTDATLFPEGPWLRWKVSKCWRAKKKNPQCTPKDRSESERLSCSFLWGKLHSLWAGSRQLARTLWKQQCTARLSATWDWWILNEGSHPVHPQGCRKPPSLLLETEKYSKDRHIPEASLWSCKPELLTFYSQEILPDIQLRSPSHTSLFLLTHSPWKFLTAANHHLQIATSNPGCLLLSPLTQYFLLTHNPSHQFIFIFLFPSHLIHFIIFLAQLFLFLV